MKKLIFLFCLFLSVSASAQRIYKVEGQPQRFTNALGIPVMPASYYNNSSDTALIFLDRNDTTTISFKFKGLVKKLASSRLPWDSLTGVPSNFSTTYGLSNDVQDSILSRVRYENATRSLNMGNYRVSARGLLGDTLFARTPAGGFIATNSGAVIASFGAGGSTEIDFKGFAGYDANRASSYTARSFTDKNYVDSSAALRVRYTDTAAMLAPFIQYSDTTGLYSQVVRTFGTQTIGGNKTFSNDIFVSTARVGVGAGGNTSNAVLGYNVFTANTTGTKNTAMGENSLSSNVSATDNTAFGWYSLDAATGSGNTGIGSGALGTNTSGSNNTALGFGAGEYVTGTNPNSTGTNSIYIGFNTKASANGETNQTVIGHNLTGNGSNTVTIGNSSVTGNYFNGFLKQTSVTSALVKASSTGQFEAAVAGTDYVAPAALSGYLPLSGGTLTLTSTSTPILSFNYSSGASNYAQHLMDNNGDYTVNIPSANGVTSGFYNIKMGGSSAFRIFQDRTITLTNTLSGTSLSMSGGATIGARVQVLGNTAPASGTGLELFYDGSGAGTLAFARGTGYIPNFMDGSQLQFFTSSNERGRFATDGTFLINTTTTDGTNKLIVNGGVKGGAFTGTTATFLSGSSTTEALIIGGAGGAGSTRQGQLKFGDAGTIYKIQGGEDYSAFNFIIGSTTVQSLASNGAATFSSSVTATGFFESSDLRLKNIVKRDGDVVYFNWKNGDDKKLHIGYIAQEVQKTNPDQVKADEKGMLSVNYTEVLVQKVRELEKQIAELQKRIK